MVPTRATRSGDGRAADRAAARNCLGRTRHSRTRRAQQVSDRGAELSGRAVRGVGGAQLCGHHRPAAQGMGRGHRSGAGQPLPRIVGAAAHPHCLGAADGAADGDRNVHADLADHELPLVDRLGSSARDAVSATRRGGPRRGRSVVRPGRVAGGFVLACLALADQLRSSIAVPLMVAASVVAVLDNGLESTAITEYAGPFWSGRSLGLQNTYQRLMAAGAPPVFGELIADHSYPPAFLICGLFPLLAVPIVPAKTLPPGLETRARTLSFRRLRRWISFRSGDWPEGTQRTGTLAQRQRLRRREKSAASPTVSRHSDPRSRDRRCRVRCRAPVRTSTGWSGWRRYFRWQPTRYRRRPRQPGP